MGELKGSLDQRVRLALEELLPAMTADGGGAELLSCDEGIVTLSFRGSCLFCPSRVMSAAALRRGIQSRVPEVLEVRVVHPTVGSMV